MLSAAAIISTLLGLGGRTAHISEMKSRRQETSNQLGATPIFSPTASSRTIVAPITKARRMSLLMDGINCFMLSSLPLPD